MHLTSSAFNDGDTIPIRHTADGPNISPALEWTGAPASAKSFALICDDPDAPRGTWVHWVLFNLPADATALPEGVATAPTLDIGAAQGKNDFRNPGYGGPSPPPGKPHRYFFRLYALDATLKLAPGCSRADLDHAMQGHLLASAQLMGKYGRTK
ncbi:MAG: YbhB/YbcL family Raf kinase inhibitor-like protein [Gemmataceae bacterium]